MPSVSFARALPCAAAMLASMGAGCTWDSFVPKGKPIALPERAPREIRTLVSCQPAEAVLDCGGRKRDDCNHWYRVDVTAPAEMRVWLDLGPPDTPGEGELTRLLVKPLEEAVVAQQVSNHGEPLTIRVSVSPDLYGVLVQGAGGRRSYRLRMALVDPETPLGQECPAAPPEAPAPD